MCSIWSASFPVGRDLQPASPMADRVTLRRVFSVLVIKTAALGDVLRTTAILPGLQALHASLRVTWVTAPAARELVAGHSAVARTVTVDSEDPASLRQVRGELERVEWDWVLSLDDEEPLVALASGLQTRRFSGARLASDGGLEYTRDVAPWFDMGLLSVHGKQRADRLKIENRRSHAQIFTSMLGLPMGRPELHLEEAQLAQAKARLEDLGVGGAQPLIGLNTGAGGRWPSKELSEASTVEMVARLREDLDRQAAFLVLGGEAEVGRNARILAGLEGLQPRPPFADGGSHNSLLQFAALVSHCDLVVASDSLAMHLAIARRVPVVAFFAPTSAAEIELFGRGEKVLSTAPDYCSYRPDADRSTLTVTRLAEAVRRVWHDVALEDPSPQ